MFIILGCGKQKLPRHGSGLLEGLGVRDAFAQKKWSQILVATIASRVENLAFPRGFPTSIRQAALPRWVAMLGRDLRMEIKKIMMIDEQESIKSVKHP